MEWTNMNMAQCTDQAVECQCAGAAANLVNAQRRLRPPRRHRIRRLQADVSRAPGKHT